MQIRMAIKCCDDTSAQTLAGSQRNERDFFALVLDSNDTLIDLLGAACSVRKKTLLSPNR